MERKIITISREYGSGGRYIGEEVAKRLGIAYYDKKIIAQTAEKTGLAEEYIEEKGEYAPSSSFFAYAFVGRHSDGSSIDDYLYAAQRQIILDVAEQGPCVIIGRCADYILRDREDCLHIFVHGNEEAKVRRIMELYHVSETEAKRQLKFVDKKRSTNYNYYTDRKWGVTQNYTLSMNSSELGYETCIEMICSLVKPRG